MHLRLLKKNSSILFVKQYKVNGEYIHAAVKITSSGKYFAKTLHSLSTCNAERQLEKGTLKNLTQIKFVV